MSKKTLPQVDHVFDDRKSLDDGAAKAKELGYKSFATRRFEVHVNGKTAYVMAYNIKDAVGRVASAGKLGIECTEIDPSPRARQIVQPTADAVLSAMSLLSEVDREKIRVALLPKIAAKN